MDQHDIEQFVQQGQQALSRRPTPTSWDLMEQMSQEISKMKRNLQLSEDARKSDRMEAERVRKHDLQQLTDEFQHKLQNMTTQPFFPVNQERGDPNYNQFPG